MPPRTRTSNDFHEIREATRAVAMAHGGVFRRSDLAAAGLDATVVRAMTRRGAWMRIHHGIYVDREDWIAGEDNPVARHRLLLSAALHILDRPAIAFGQSAALLHGLPLPSAPAKLELARDLGTDGRAFERKISRHGPLAMCTIRSHRNIVSQGVLVDGIPSVPIETAAVTAGAQLSMERAVAILDATLWEAPARLDRIRSLALEWGHLRGIGTLRQAIRLARSGAQTPLESISRVRLMDRGVPEPELQVRLDDEDGTIGVVDMAWLAQRVIGEADGLLKYHLREDLIAEKRREDRLREAGFLVVRWTWDDILRKPDAVAARVRRAMELNTRGAA